MKKGMFLILICLLLASCLLTTIQMEMSPATPSEARCAPHPQFTSYSIKKIGVLDLQDSDKSRREKFVPHPTFGVQPYDVYIYLKNNDGAHVAGMVEAELSSSYKYRVVERRNLLQLEDEHARNLAGHYDEKEVKKIGKMSGADALLTGKVTDAYAFFEAKTAGAGGAGGFMGTYIGFGGLELRLVHVQSGDIVWNCSIKRSSLNYLAGPTTVTNHDVIKNPHVFDAMLHGISAEERINYVLGQIIREAIRFIQ